jgi:hypothetical protein
MTTRTRLIALASAVFILYAIYFAAGLRYFASESCLALVDYSLYPQDVPKRWAAMPSPGLIARRALFAKDAQQVKTDFKRLKLTLYSGAIGYRDAFSKVSDVRPLLEQLRVQEIAQFFMRSGIDTSSAWVDEAGCSAVHQALILRDSDGAQKLVTLGHVDPGLINETSRASDCRISVAELAARAHISLNFGK